MSNIQTGAERMPHDLSHLGFLAGQIGRLITISTTPVIAGDSFEMDAVGALRLSPLRRGLAIDSTVDILDRKSGSAGMPRPISYAVFCLKKKKTTHHTLSPKTPLLLCVLPTVIILACFFFFNDTATTEIYTLSLHDALPICQIGRLITISTTPVIAGDSFEMDAVGALRLSPLRRGLAIDSTVDIFTFYVPHRHVYGEQWIKFMKDGVNATPLPTVNTRSEERRVGKECRSRWSPYH